MQQQSDINIFPIHTRVTDKKVGVPWGPMGPMRSVSIRWGPIGPHGPPRAPWRDVVTSPNAILVPKLLLVTRGQSWRDRPPPAPNILCGGSPPGSETLVKPDGPTLGSETLVCWGPSPGEPMEDKKNIGIVGMMGTGSWVNGE